MDEAGTVRRLMHYEVKAELISLQERADDWIADLMLSIEHAKVSPTAILSIAESPHWLPHVACIDFHVRLSIVSFVRICPDGRF